MPTVSFSLPSHRLRKLAENEIFFGQETILAGVSFELIRLFFYLDGDISCDTEAIP